MVNVTLHLENLETGELFDDYLENTSVLIGDDYGASLNFEHDCIVTDTTRQRKMLDRWLDAVGGPFGKGLDRYDHWVEILSFEVEII